MSVIQNPLPEAVLRTAAKPEESRDVPPEILKEQRLAWKNLRIPIKEFLMFTGRPRPDLDAALYGLAAPGLVVGGRVFGAHHLGWDGRLAGQCPEQE